MEEYVKIISRKEFNWLLQLTQKGIELPQIKKAVIELFKPYFENCDILQKLAMEALVPDAVTLIKLQSNIWGLEMFKKCLASYRIAKEIDSTKSFQACARWENSISEGLSGYWSMANLELDKSKLKLADYTHEYFKIIGSLLESVLKPYLKALLHQISISIRQPMKYNEINCKDFGEVVTDLINDSGYPELFMPPPWNIKLSQWRNIALHFDYSIKRSRIICRYGKGRNVKKVILSRKGVSELAQLSFTIFSAVKLARTIYLIDNLKEVQKFGSRGKQREEADFLNFSAAIAIQGFKIINYKSNKRKALIILQDVSSMDPYKRRLHASQFVYPLWRITKSSLLEVEYRQEDGAPNFLISASADMCKKVNNGEIEFSALAGLIGMKDLRTGKCIPVSK